MAGAVIAAVVVAGAMSYMTTPIYESTAQLTFVSQPDIASALSGSASITSTAEVQIQAQTYADLMTSAEMTQRAAIELGYPVPVAVKIQSAYVPDTSVLRISARSSSPREAQAVANAYAAGFTNWRKQVAIDQYNQAERVVTDRVNRYGNNPNRFSDPSFVQLVGRLQDIRLLKSTASGNFLIVAAGELPKESVLPQHVRDLMLGLLIGLVLGVGAVILVEQLDIRLHSVDEVAGALGLPIMARIPKVSSSEIADGRPVTLKDPLGPSAEAYRIFRGNLEFADIAGAARIVMLTSATQGEGKSTTASNLAVAVALSGRRVILVDADLRRASAHRFFGLRNNVGLSTVLTGRTSLTECLHEVELPVGGDEVLEGAAAGSLRVLTSGPLPPNPGEIASSQRLAKLLASLIGVADLVLVDAPPFLVVGDASAISRAADGIVDVARLGTLTRAIAQESREVLATLPCRVLGVVVVGIPMEGAAHRYRYYSHHEDETTDDTVPERQPTA